MLLAPATPLALEEEESVEEDCLVRVGRDWSCAHIVLVAVLLLVVVVGCRDIKGRSSSAACLPAPTPLLSWQPSLWVWGEQLADDVRLLSEMFGTVFW